MLMDHSGACKIEGWADDWNHQYGMLEVGDLVVVANVGLDEGFSKYDATTPVNLVFKSLSELTAQPLEEMVVTRSSTLC